jgi:multiple antibiotic resistance protein
MGFGFLRTLETVPVAALATFLALFPILNPIGALPLFCGLTSDYTLRQRRITELKIALFVIAILVVFLFLGRFVLHFFGISLPVLKIAGGIIVANTSWGMVTGVSRLSSDESADAASRRDISFSPMAMPMVTGPGSIGVVMGLAAHTSAVSAYVGMVIGIIALGAVTFLVFFLGRPLVGRLGPNTIGPMNRIFGFLILAVAVQLVWDGVADFHLAG